MRDAQKWYRSYYNAIIKTIRHPILLFVARRLKYFVPYACRYIEVFKYGLIKTFKSIEGPDAFDKQYAINEFNRRNQSIIEYFQTSDEMDRFMIIDWERKDKNKMFLELMEFIGVTFTAEELEERARVNKGSYFPHRNNTAKM